MTEQQELEAWRSEWTSLPDVSMFARDVVDRAAREGRSLKRRTAKEIAAVLFSSGMCLWLLLSTHGKAQVVAISVVILLFNGAWITHYFNVRAGTFAASGEGLDAFVALTRKRITADRRWNRYALRWTQILALILVPWSVWMFLGHRDKYLAEPWRALVGFGGEVVILTALFFYLGRQRARLDVNSKRFEEQLQQVDPTV
jgi:hypothetical protein